MSTPYTIQENKEANLQFNVSECQRHIEHIQLQMSIIENTLSFTGLTLSEMRECEDSLKEYKVDLVKAQNKLDEAMDNLLGQTEDEPAPYWEQEEAYDFWGMLLS